jgi:hypothetical protein
VNIKAFLGTALQSALDLEIATCDDVVRHVTPNVLAEFLPRPLWARLLTAALGAPHVDAQLVVETIGIPNLCEHVPAAILWACLHEIGSRSLDGYVPPVHHVAPMPPASTMVTPTRVLPATPLTAPPPEIIAPAAPAAPPPPLAAQPSIPAPLDLGEGLGDIMSELDAPTPSRPRSPTAQRFRQSSTGIGRLAAANTSRKAQAQAPVPETHAATPTERPRTPPRRGSTEVSDYEVETDVGGGKDDWKDALAVEDEQLVDWSSSEETVTSGDDFRNGRKR